MPRSLNVAFTGTADDDTEFDHPPGESIARMLVATLSNAGWTVSDFDNWRDCGWSFECHREETHVLVALAQTDKAKWMLQVSPLSYPGSLRRLLGAKPSATPQGVLALAQAVHGPLSKQQAFSDLRWRWDDYPDEERSTAEPAAPVGTQ